MKKSALSIMCTTVKYICTISLNVKVNGGMGIGFHLIYEVYTKVKNKNTEIMKFSMTLGCRLEYAVRKMTYDNEAAEAFWNGMSFSELKELCWKT